MLPVTTRWALATGVSEGGLGDALLMELLSQNFNVIATALNINLLDYLPESSHIFKFELDVTSAESISVAAKEIATLTNGRLDLLINNAGYGYMMPLMDANPRQVMKNFDVNVIGILAITQAFFPLLKEARGTVANQCSIAGLNGARQPFIGTYCATKAAALSLNDTMRVELAPFGIKVVALVTGDVKTRFWKNASGAHVGIPELSPYKMIGSHVEKVMRGETNPPGQHPRDRWAAKVVSDLLKSSPSRYVRRGYLGTTMWIVSWIVPTWLLDYAYIQSSGLGKLKALLGNDHKKTT